ncbi:MAG: PilZ domain-containing protein [Desulfobacterales bacterium]|nr:PilZ domain-containing protein [Desulfobacterales bacterium]
MERRQYPRVKTSNLISYVSQAPNGRIVEQNMAKALNISQSGIFLETTHRILSDSISMMSVDDGNNLIELKGEVIYSSERSNGRFGAGVRFQGTHNQNIQFAMKLVKSFNAQKHNVARTYHTCS